MTKAQLNKTAHKFGGQLTQQGIWWQRKAFKPQKFEYNKSTIKRFVEGQITGKENTTSLYDQKYFVTSLENWKEIMYMDLVDLEKYISDHRDCDNYAFLFASRASMIYGLNSCLVCTGSCFNKDGKLIRHAFNVIITENNGILYPYVYEPQTDAFALLNMSGTEISSPNWTYNFDWCLAF